MKQHPGVKWLETDILQSAEDKRSYAGLELQNGLKVLLVSDPTTDKSSAALDVRVGRYLNHVELVKKKYCLWVE